MSSPKPPGKTFQDRNYPATLREILAAQNEGARAVNDNQPPVVCPYRGMSEQEVFLAEMWHRGYRHRQQIIRAATSDDTTLQTPYG